MTGWLSLILCLAVFAGTAMSGRKSATGIGSFFHLDGRARNAIALGIADITLGTGFAYLLTASSQLGWVMLLLPLGLWLGYRGLGLIYARMPNMVMSESGNLLLAVREAAVRSTGEIGRRWFDVAVTLPLIAIFLMFLAYEVFASSQIIAAFVAPQSPWAPALIGGAIVAVSGSNSIAGGAQSNWRNDHVLAAGIILLFAIVALGSAFAPQTAPATSAEMPWTTVAIVTSLAFLSSVATQFYSLLNNYNGSNFVSGSDAARCFRTVGLVIALLLAGLVAIGSWHPLNLSGGFPAALGARIDSIPASPALHVLISALTVIGMVSVVFSTIDTLILALAYFVRRHLLDRATVDSSSNVESLKPTRALVALLSFGIVPPLAILYIANPNLFLLLLTLGGGAAVFAPLLGFGGYALASGFQVQFSLKYVLIFTFLFGASGITGAMTMGGAPQLGASWSLAWLISAIAVAGIWYLRLPRHRAASPL
jgi:hypothetical protein